MPEAPSPVEDASDVPAEDALVVAASDPDADEADDGDDEDVADDELPPAPFDSDESPQAKSDAASAQVAT